MSPVLLRGGATILHQLRRLAFFNSRNVGLAIVMKITANRERLLSAFQITAMVANARSPKEILQNVKLVVGVNSATLMATDMEMGIRIKVDGVEIEQKGGDALLPVVRFGAILRESRDETITITTKGTETLVESERASFRLPSANPNEYPNVESDTEESYHELPASLLRDMIRRTSFCTDQDTSRYTLAGVLFELTKTEAYAIGTDGRRMARMSGTGKSVGHHQTTPNQTIVPVRALALIAKALAECKDDEPVRFAARGNGVFVGTLKASVHSRLVEGRYPNWRNVIPKRDTPILIDLSVGPFFSAIRQAAIVADVETHGLDFEFGAGDLVISTKTANLGASRVSVPIAYTGDEVRMKLDHRYISDFLKLLDSETNCTANIASSSEALLLTTDDGYQYVVMPMALER